MENLSIEEKFRAAVHLIRNLPKKGSFQPSNETMLKFYSYYKQATEGPCTIPKPSFWDIVNKAKWEAWKNLGDMPKQQAMEHYVDELSKAIQTTAFSENVDEFMHVVGPFYELIPGLKEMKLETQQNGDLESEEESFEQNIDDNSSEALANNIGVAEAIAKQLKSRKYDSDRESKSRMPIGGSGTSGAVNGHKMNGNDDSESEEFSDTCDQINEVDNGSPDDDDEEIAAHLLPDTNNYSLPKLQTPIWDVNSTCIGMQARGGGDQQPGSSGSADKNPVSSGGRQARVQPARGAHLEAFHPRYSNASGTGGSGSRGGGRGSGARIDTSVDLGVQLALAVIKLQHTMEEVVSRLDSLEMLLQNRQSNGNNLGNTISKWTLLGLPPKALFLLIVWPFVAHWVMFIIHRRQRH